MQILTKQGFCLWFRSDNFKMCINGSKYIAQTVEKYPLYALYPSEYWTTYKKIQFKVVTSHLAMNLDIMCTFLAYRVDTTFSENRYIHQYNIIYIQTHFYTKNAQHKSKILHFWYFRVPNNSSSSAKYSLIWKLVMLKGIKLHCKIRQEEFWCSPPYVISNF